MSHSTIEEAVQFAVTAADEAYNECSDAGETHTSSNSAAKDAYRDCFPVLCSRSDVKAYIACVAKGIQLGYVGHDEARLMMYGAQVWLTVDNLPSVPDTLDKITAVWESAR